MLTAKSDFQGRRLTRDAGIAIGPILFIIAVLGILAAAIAAGSGTFTTSTVGESNRAKAAALIEMGQNLKIGMDRIIGNAVDFADVVIAPANTSATTDLFSPSGGGVAAPSTTMSATPGTDIWYYIEMAYPSMGTASNEKVAVIRVASGVCTEINSKANAIATPAGADLGDFSGDVGTGANWPAALAGKPTGCVQNTNVADALNTGYFFYQILAIQ